MPAVQCPHCQATLNAKPERIGTQANCPKCRMPFVLGQAAGEVEAPTVADDDTLDPKLIGTTAAATSAVIALALLLFAQVGLALGILAVAGAIAVAVHRPEWIGMAARWSNQAATTAAGAAAAAAGSLADARARAKEAKRSAAEAEAARPKPAAATPAAASVQPPAPVDRRLGPEQDIWTIRPSIFKTYPAASTFMTLVFAVGVLLAALDASMRFAGISAAGVALLFLFRMWFACAGTTLTITTKRSRLRRGVFSKQTSEVRHKDIRQVKVSQGFVDRIWNVGALAISSSAGGGDEIAIGGISDVEQVADLIRELQD